MKKIIFLVCIILIVVVGFTYFSRPAATIISQNQKDEELTKMLGRKVNLEDKEAKPDESFEGKLISFKYPGDAIIYKYKDPGFQASEGLLESFSYDTKNPKVVFNYSSYERPDVKSLDDDSSYHLRTIPERGYNKKTIKIGGSPGFLFQQDGSETSERDIFVFKNGTLYSFVFTGSDISELDSLVNQLIGSIQWHK